ncbi:N-acetylmuramic acid 6-phosphate etherase [Tissierella sp. MSJ-40]|uniref:N-acetylmuramic acid 6-phosphate etherase n=1 Tax=Tissierella simiarum TaxID=2841534 RepID=A0ABS6E7N6_9FIRM|nr:N-acetylmuramic acid 6-phosphate etherase [Tissierella simiarum]MBU5438935.1 N-acetylmuramic acid 6-phosphate etherase [Tissierella simiarum]
MELGSLITEQINENTKNIDRATTLEMVRMINDEDKKVAYAVEKELENISSAIDIIAKKIEEGGRLIYMGAGTSGRLGILDASECPPTYGVNPELVQGLIAGGHTAMFKAVEGSEDSKELGIEDLKIINLNSRDVLVGIAASGRTPYVIGGLTHADKIGCPTISITCNPNSEMSKLSKLSISPIVGPEVVSGSTRMKAGTAQKMVLNMLSTGVMIKLGKVYGNLMVDVQTNNIKLIERAKSIIMQATDVSRKVAEEYLDIAENDVKLAILMIITNVSKEVGIELLEKHKGYLAKAIDDAK